MPSTVATVAVDTKLSTESRMQALGDFALPEHRRLGTEISVRPLHLIRLESINYALISSARQKMGVWDKPKLSRLSARGSLHIVATLPNG